MTVYVSSRSSQCKCLRKNSGEHFPEKASPVYFIHVSYLRFYSFLWIIEVCSVYCLFHFDIAFTHLVEKMRIQNTENSEKENLETKHEIKTKREVNKDKTKL